MRPLFFLLFFSLIQLGFSQSSFEPGYLVTDAGDSLSCWIKYLEKYVSPKEVVYRLEKTGEIQSGSVEAVRAFGIPGKVRYERAWVLLDTSKDQETKLSTERAPQFENRWLFLEVLIQGYATLYRYAEPELQRFFYRLATEPDTAIHPLVHKLYLKTGENKLYQTTSTTLAENNTFQQTLWAEVNCNGRKSQADLAKVKYTQKALVNYFIQYNQCLQGADFINYQDQRSGDQFHLALRPGLHYSIGQVWTANSIRPVDALAFNGISYRLGVELEWQLPFRNNRFGLILEPVWQNTSPEPEAAGAGSSFSYQSLEANLGVRARLLMKERMHLWANAGLGFDLRVFEAIYRNRFGTPFSSQRSTERLFLGAGLDLFQRFQLEVRYDWGRDPLADLLTPNSRLNYLSAILGWRVF